MKSVLKMGWIAVCAAVMGTAQLWGAGAAPAASKGDDAELLQMIRTAMSSRVMIMKAVKGYMYAGNHVATTKAQKEMVESLKKFDAKQKKLQEAFTDPKIKNLMMFIQMNEEELKDLLKEPYSLENAEVIIDLGEAISEGEKKIGDTLRKRLSGNYPAAKGQRYYVAQVALYYMAYQAGIRDENTIRKMERIVKTLDQLIQESKAYPGNTVKMNQVINQIEKLWKVVHQFYLDIEEGGLPLIVYQTTDKLDKKFFEYAQLLNESLKKK